MSSSKESKDDKRKGGCDMSRFTSSGKRLSVVPDMPVTSGPSVPQGGRPVAPVPTLEQFLEGLRNGGILTDVQKVRW